MRVLLIILLLLLPGWALGHQGFNQLSWQESLGNYRVSVLEDFHLRQNGDGAAQLIVQLSEGQRAAPKETTIWLEVALDGQMIYQDFLPLRAQSSADGKSFYSSYLYRQDLEQAGWYDLMLEISGPLGNIERHYVVQAQQGERFAWLAYAPFLVILLLCTAGLLLLFAPLPRQLRKDYHEAHSPLFKKHHEPGQV